MKIEATLTPLPAMPARPDAAKQLEGAFLEEMLKYCGPKASEGAFSGGAGEAQFSSFLTREYAAILSESLDLGLADDLKGQAT